MFFLYDSLNVLYRLHITNVKSTHGNWLRTYCPQSYCPPQLEHFILSLLKHVDWYPLKKKKKWARDQDISVLGRVSIYQGQMCKGTVQNILTLILPWLPPLVDVKRVVVGHGPHNLWLTVQAFMYLHDWSLWRQSWVSCSVRRRQHGSTLLCHNLLVYCEDVSIGLV